MKHRAIVLSGAFLTGCLCATIMIGQFGGRPSDVRPPLARALPDDLTENERNSIVIFEEAAASVVFVVNKTLVRDWFSLNVQEVRQGAGSGFVWDREGHIVTNFHVVHNGRRFSVIFGGQHSFDAELVGAAPEKDLAVLKIDAPAALLSPVAKGSSSDLRVGQKVLAIGNPFGLDRSLTAGIVSALGREIKSLVGRTINDVIQTDAAINPGNSGGPLLDSRGRLVGVNTAIFSPSGAYAGIGFAVPVDTIKRVIPNLIQYGRFKRPSLGAEVIPDSYARQLGVDGVILHRVPPESAAAKAGLRGTRQASSGRGWELGDVVVKLDGQRVRTLDDLLNALERLKVGDTVTVTYVREGKESGTTAVLQDLAE